MAQKRKHRHIRIGLIILLLVLVSVTGFGLWFAGHYKTVLRERIPGWVAKATDSVYKISFDDVNINIYTRRVTVTGVKLWLDTNQLARLRMEGRAPHVFYTTSIPVIQVKGIAWESMATDKELKCHSLVILNPQLIITRFPETPADSLHRVNDSIAKAYENKPPSIEAIHIKQVVVTHPHVSYITTDTAGRTAQLLLNEGSIVLNDIELDPQKKGDSSRFLYAKSASVRIDSFEYKKEKLLYTIRATGIILDPGNNKLELKNFKLKPNVSQEEFYRAKGHQTDMFTLSFPDVKLRGFNWRSIAYSGTIAVDTVMLQDPVLEDYFSRLVPPNPESKKGKFPNQLIARMKQKLDIRYIKIRNGHVKYTEVNEKTKMAGVLRFDGVNGNVTNATNLPEQLAKNSQCTIHLNGQFMKSSPISAAFNLSLSDPGGAFTVEGQLKDLDAPQIQPMVKALAVTEIQSVHISKIDLHITGNEDRGQGTVTMLYNDLKIGVQKVDSSKRLKDKPLLSFLANTLVIYPDNPMKNQPVRNESSVVVRDAHKSFFNLIWKCIFNCVEKTAIRSDNIEQALEEKQNHPNEKKSLLKRIFGGKDKKKKDKK